MKMLNLINALISIHEPGAKFLRHQRFAVSASGLLSELRSQVGGDGLTILSKNSPHFKKWPKSKHTAYRFGDSESGMAILICIRACVERNWSEFRRPFGVCHQD
jgi:hypothetical protein